MSEEQTPPTINEQFVAVPVQTDDKGYPDYDAWLFLEHRNQIDVREIEGYLLNGYLVEAEEAFLKSGLTMEEQNLGGCEMILVSDPRDNTWYVGIQLVTDAFLYKPVSLSNNPDDIDYQRAPTARNVDGTVNFDGWAYLEGKYRLQTAALKMAIIHMDDELAIELAQSELTYGEFPEHPDVVELSVKHRRNMKQEVNDDNNDEESDGDDDEDYDEFQIICFNTPTQPEKYPRYVGVQLRSEAILYRTSSKAGQGIRRVTQNV